MSNKKAVRHAPLSHQMHKPLIHAELESKGTIPSPRVAHSAVVIGSNIWVFGGRSGKQVLNEWLIEEYD